MKKVYFTTDKSSVVCFYKDEATGKDPQRLDRLKAVIGKYNPTTDPPKGTYYKRIFCWPTAIITQPRLGFVAPVYPSNFFFQSGRWANQEKKGYWFKSPKFRPHLPADEHGSFMDFISIGILMARAIARLHLKGLAHSDLSPNNILIDPAGQQIVVIDIDSLVVRGLYPPDVAGTPGYIAPEVLATMHLPLRDPNRIYPSITTDLHALAVLIYEYLLFRHPLKGPKVRSMDPDKDEYLCMGPQALFIEHPKDHSNRPKNLKVSSPNLGPFLHKLFQQAFVDGLHEPRKRPSASDWTRNLVKTWNMLYPCPSKACIQKWFVLYDKKNVACPFCGKRLKGTIPVVTLRRENRPGNWVQDGQLVIYDNRPLFKWDIFDHIHPGELSDTSLQAYCVFYQGKWLLINKELTSLTSPSGNRVGQGKAVELVDGARIRLSRDPHGMMADVEIVRT